MADTFASLGGGTCHNGGWLPPGMSIPGGGAPAVRFGAADGDLWPGGASARYSLNNFDINGCDGLPETLPDGRLFNICGEGMINLTATTISGSITGTTWIGGHAEFTGLCNGAIGVTFVRRGP